MKGKNRFTISEIEMIKNLITQKLRAGPDKQKGIRNKIRNIGFYYSDFDSSKDGYTVQDIEKLISRGEIKVISGIYKPPPASTKDLLKKTPSTKIDTKQSNTHSKKSFAPIYSSDIKILILGTMPGELSLKLSQYYAHPRNRFWKLISTITKSDLPINWDQKKELLKKYKIGLWDVAESAIRIGSLDSAIKKAKPNNLISFLKENNRIRVIGFNGNKSADLYDSFFPRNPGIIYLILPSSSPANTGISFESMCKHWKQIFD